MPSKPQRSGQAIYPLIIVVLAVIVVYFSINSYYTQTIIHLQDELNGANKSYGDLLASYNALKNQIYNPPSQLVYSNMSITLNSLLYPYYTTPSYAGYNVSYLSYFLPTLTYVYYNKYANTYLPLNNVNSSYSEFEFNVTEQTSGYLTINYTSDSPSGISVLNSDCLANLFTQHTITYYAASDGNVNGSISIPIREGKNCLYLSNPSNETIEMRFSATYVPYAG
jgi:hypothetical protein